MPTRTIHGGEMQDIPHPHRRYWPEATEPRRVSVRFTDWSAAIGGSHISLKIQEEHNYIWSETKQAWIEPWDDTKGTGFELETKFERYEDAVKVARAVVKIMFSDEKKHRVDWDGVRQTRHRYARQSD